VTALLSDIKRARTAKELADLIAGNPEAIALVVLMSDLAYAEGDTSGGHAFAIAAAAALIR